MIPPDEPIHPVMGYLLLCCLLAAVVANVAIKYGLALAVGLLLVMVLVGVGAFALFHVMTTYSEYRYRAGFRRMYR